jgi:hypothetical protein
MSGNNAQGRRAEATSSCKVLQAEWKGRFNLTRENRNFLEQTSSGDAESSLLLAALVVRDQNVARIYELDNQQHPH